MISKGKYWIGVLAIALLTSCSTVSTKQPVSLNKAAEYNAELGAMYLRQGDLSTAKRKLDKAIEQDSENAFANNVFALLSMRLGQYAKAEKHFRKAIKLDPDNTDYPSTFGVFLCQRKRFDEAQKQFMLAANNPLNKVPESALDNAGICALDQKNLPLAETYFRRALKRNAKFAPALLNLADVSLQQRRANLADAYLQRYHRYASESPSSLWLGVQIAQQLNDPIGARRYGEQLISQYPEAKQTTLYLESNNK